ncbi:hypothetical protein Srut_42870 [Streptomyces rutgersensis]|nr:hypothetical protein Srut_42870 [Streptomyces rutgersensis]
MGFSSTPPLWCRRLGEWFRPWLPGRVPASLEQRKERPQTPAGTFQAFLTEFLGEIMKSVRVFVAAVLCVLTVGAAAGTAAAESGGAGVLVASSTGPGDDSGWGRVAG